MAARVALPTSEETLLLFASYLAKQGLAHTTIKVYLSAVRNLHVSAGLHLEFAQQLTPRLELVLQGIKKEYLRTSQHRHTRLPITKSIMSKIRLVLQQRTNNYNNKLLWAACCTAFFGFLRCSEFTVPSQNDYDPDSHLSLSDVSVDSRMEPSMIRIYIKQSKTDPFRQGVHLCLGRTGNAICPVTSLLSYLIIRKGTPGPLFVMENGQYLTRQLFGAHLNSILQEVGQNAKHYNTHSFRIGAATSARESGVSDENIQMLGRWKSDAYKLYIRTPREELAKLSGKLVAGLSVKEN